MRLVSYFILVYLMLGIQVGISRYIHGAAPNLALITVIFISLNAPRDAALLGSFGIGLVQDLLTSQQPGLYAFSYGLVAMLIVSLSTIVKRTHPLTHVVVALVGGLMTMAVLLVHSLIHPAAPALVSEGHPTLAAVRISAKVEFIRVLYTMILAPFLLWALGKIRDVFSFQNSGRGRR